MGLVGKWRSTDAMGNTALDWSGLLKEEKAVLFVEFKDNGKYSVRLESNEGKDITSTQKHLPPIDGTYTVEGDCISIVGDESDLDWTYENEEENTLRIRLSGAKRFGRCNGVDVIYFEESRTEEANE